MLQDLIKIKPQTKRNYYTGKYEFATAVPKPIERARYFFRWGMIFHAQRKPAQAYKYYEKAIFHNKKPLYLKQMAILHHEMNYPKEALEYMRVALDIEKQEQMEKERVLSRLQAPNYSAFLPFKYQSHKSQSTISLFAKAVQSSLPSYPIHYSTEFQSYPDPG